MTKQWICDVDVRYPVYVKKSQSEMSQVCFLLLNTAFKKNMISRNQKASRIAVEFWLTSKSFVMIAGTTQCISRSNPSLEESDFKTKENS